ncbi:MAG TPA: hypothetical protein VM118_01925 [Acidobacteriota bacterium]|nr:hypothetical protein [Acidobacteriota bacterium]
MKREIPLIITGVVGIVFIVQFFIPHEPFSSLSDIFSDWFSIIEACAIWLGALNLIKLSLDKLGKPMLLVTSAIVVVALIVGIVGAPDEFLAGRFPLILFAVAFLLMALGQYSRSKMKPDWFFALTTIASFVIMLIAGLAFSGGRTFQEPGTHYDYLYRSVYTPLSSTMFAMLAFFVASASYRAFRARNREAAMLLVAAFFVMAGRVPLAEFLGTLTPDAFSGAWATTGGFLSGAADWVMNFPNAAGQRAIMIGIALGIVSTSLRIILGIERSHIGGE